MEVPLQGGETNCGRRCNLPYSLPLHFFYLLYTSFHRSGNF
ncbi:hypothetical protein [Methanofervidicoccus sp. A16]|nr:hypothetical protein [Methanofervidicoccus sp. A16]